MCNSRRSRLLPGGANERGAWLTRGQRLLCSGVNLGPKSDGSSCMSGRHGEESHLIGKEKGKNRRGIYRDTEVHEGQEQFCTRGNSRELCVWHAAATTTIANSLQTRYFFPPPEI